VITKDVFIVSVISTLQFKVPILSLCHGGVELPSSGANFFFEHGYHLAVLERLSFDLGTVVIESYGYEVWHGSRKIMWYDSQPHPNDQELQASHPHHKHVPPDIKHNRIPAPQLSFIKPNLPVLIEEIINLVSSESTT